MKRLLLHGAIFLIAILLQNKISAQQWVNLSSVSPQEVSVTNIVNDSYGIDFEISVAGFFKKDSTVAGNTYHKIGIGGCGLDTKVGKPQLPLIRQMVAIPECTNVTATLSNQTYTILNDYYICPAPELVEVQQNGYTSLVEQFAIDNQAYSQNAWYPSESIYINSISYLREQKVAEVYIAPIQFNPVTHQIRIITGCDGHINTTNPSGAMIRNTGIFGQVAKSSLLNYTTETISARINDHSSISGSVQWYTLSSPASADAIDADYLIITAGKFFAENNYNSQTYRIAQHRANYNGFKVAILNVQNIVSDAVGFQYENPNQTNGINIKYKAERRIRSCIKRIYENGLAQHTHDGHLGYVLLIGDAQRHILTDLTDEDHYKWVAASYDPDPSLTGSATDFYYTCITETNPWEYDRIGDLFIGRFPADNQNELYNIVQKTIDHETEAAFYAPLNALYALGGFLDSPGITTIRDYFENPNGFNYEYLPRLITPPYTHTLRDYYNSSTNLTTSNLFSDINSGIKLFSYYGHSNEYVLAMGQSGASFDTISCKQNLNNHFNYPFYIALSCSNGQFDMNPYTNDCFAETLTKYSAVAGFIGSLASWSTANLDISASIPIVPKTFYEVFQSNYWERLAHVAGELVLQTKEQFWESPSPGANGPKFNFNLFCDPALNLFAEGYQVTHNVTLNGEVFISNEVRVKPGSTLTVAAGTHVHFVNNGKLIVESGATLAVLNQGTLITTFDGVSDNNYLAVYGNINNFNRVSFTATTGLHWGGLQIANPLVDLSFNNTTQFVHSGIRIVNGTYSFNGTSFTDSWFTVYGSTADIQNCQFTNGSYIIGDGMGSKSVGIQIKNCSVLNSPANMEAIRLERFPVYNIENNQITYTDKDGLGLYNCGSLQTRNHYIKNNTITFAGTQANNNNGLKLYCTYAEVDRNNIHHNSIGISLLNTTNSKLIGNSSASNSSQTQVIANNSVNQVYLAQMSSAPQVTYNAIYVDQPNTSPYIRYETTGYPSPIITVNYNYWGGNNGMHHPFVPTADLDPYNKFLYNSNLNWNLPSKNSTVIDTCETIYSQAHALLADSNISAAIEKYKELINTFPGHVLAGCSLSELFDVYWVNSLNLSELKAYFLCNTVTSNAMLVKKGAWLANKCDIYSGNLYQGVVWLDSVAQNPQVVSDSVYALIELADIYSNDSTKSGYFGSLASLLPQSRTEFLAKRKEWIDLLFADKTIYNEQPVKDTELSNLIITPNPTNQDAEIEFVCANTGLLSLCITDLKGSQVLGPYSIPVTQGRNTIKLSGIYGNTCLKNGLYLLSLSNDAIKVSSKLIIK
jgi:hypothetical protein